MYMWMFNPETIVRKYYKANGVSYLAFPGSTYDDICMQQTDGSTFGLKTYHITFTALTEQKYGVSQCTIYQDVNLLQHQK